MRKLLDAAYHNVPFYVLSSISIILIIAGFICPPLAVIDNSVLLAVGELIGWGALWCLLLAIKNGHSATIQHGTTTLTVKKENTIGEEP